MIEIENQNSLEHALYQGINLFVGAGFSILAKDETGRALPLGCKLAEELAEYFGKPKYYPLPQLCSILTSTPYVAYYDSVSESIQDKTFTIDSYYEHSPLVIGEYVDPQGEIGPVIVKKGTKLSIKPGVSGTTITDCFECEKGAVLIIK